MLLISIAAIAGLVLGVFALISLYYGLSFASHSKEGIIKYSFYVLLLGNAVLILMSVRDFSDHGTGEYFESGLKTSAIAEWTMRFSSLFVMLASLERILYFLRQEKIDFTRLSLALLAVYMWVGNVLVPYIINGNEPVKIGLFYSLIFIPALILSLQDDKLSLVYHTRNGLVWFVLFSLLAIVFMPYHVMDFAYTQGYIPGLPRFFGLTPHATLMGLLAGTAFWITLVYPYENKRWNRFVLVFTLLALILSQSKTVFVAFVIGLFIFAFYSEKYNQRIKSRIPIIKTTLYFGTAFVLMVGLLAFFFVDFDALIHKHLTLEQINNLETLTGRDIIWHYALQEFYRNPWFGYGSGLFSSAYREQIGLVNAIHGHNLFLDAMGRSGILGASGYFAMFIVMGYYSFKFGYETKGLTVSLYILLFLFSMTSVPIALTNIGQPNFIYFILLILIAAYIKRVDQPKKEPVMTAEKHVQYRYT